MIYQVGPAATVNYEAAGASDDWAKVKIVIMIMMMMMRRRRRRRMMMRGGERSSL